MADQIGRVDGELVKIQRFYPNEDASGLIQNRWEMAKNVRIFGAAASLGDDPWTIGFGGSAQDQLKESRVVDTKISHRA
jgi:hypothetical protein